MYKKNKWVNRRLTSSLSPVGAIITAAGFSQRMGELDKIFTLVGGKLVIARVVDVFQSCDFIDQIVVVVNKWSLDKYKQLVAGQAWSKVADVRPGGKRRQDSVVSGLNHLRDCHWVVIHDGARPLVTEDLIRRGLEEAKETGSAVAAVPVTDTIKVAGDDRLVQHTPLRDNLWVVQTPQVFRFDIITEAYRRVKSDATDDASLVEQSGHKVKLYMGSYDNIKVTIPADLALAEWILSHRRDPTL